MLEDLGFHGDPFTWCNNNYRVEGYIREQLDRDVANCEWRMRFPLYRVINGDPKHSDHRPVIVECGNVAPKKQRKAEGGKLKVETWWLEDEECKI